MSNHTEGTTPECCAEFTYNELRLESVFFHHSDPSLFVTPQVR